ncbi:hypothetical protein AUR04nite_12610 [Glutamicibacter uratoxydans]|uniref:MobA-like NTP transferase domain-containing protein n=1 Tax=Glutamicibacter uratoxydans TaxID=43667 RepID=A0A4Y4DK88_GLUUR|nr:nucleotidyltransferase family protein [Glutamicibacter uratoxydans]GED05729.1 hypothetical protein AUR04nite_12610 [Glutamicibacter uratoxydans]
MSHKRYVIMANGRGTRWGSHLGIPKQLIEIEGETLLRRIVRQVSQFDPTAEVVISSGDPRHETEGAVRYVPLRNEIELDRFVEELITNNTCFLYGDTYYSDEAIRIIVRAASQGVAFFGDERSIVGVSCHDESLFRHHLQNVRDAFAARQIENCIGWQVYQSFVGRLFDDIEIGDYFVRLDERMTCGFNSPEDLRKFIDVMGRDFDVSASN